MHSTYLSLALLTASGAWAAVQRGLPYSDPKVANFFSSKSAATWGYNWGYPAHELDKRFEFIPMLYTDPSRDSGYQAEWAAAVKSAAANGTKHLLAFNEPDINNLSPATAAAAYVKFMNPYASQFKLGAPAVTNGGGATGLTWLEQFMGNCTQCHIDFVPIHWYANWNQPAYFAAHVQQAHSVAKKPLWITEFEGQGTETQQVSFIKTVLPWLDSLSYMERYAWFGVFPNRLINSDGTGLSRIGHAFVETSGANSTVPTTNVPA